jgi:acyl-CoA dehydrogenase
MRLIGAAERGMDLMVERALNRTAFGKRIAQHGSFLSDLAKVRSLFFIVCMACF